MTTWAIPINNSDELARRQLNDFLAQAQALLPGHAGTLPDPSTQPENRLFAKTGAGAGLYQLRSGAWVLVAS